MRSTANLYLGSLRIFCGPRWENLAGRLVSSVRDMLTAHADEFMRLRAGAVTMNDEALLLPSVPNPHLPTLAALLTRAGAGYLGDEIVFLDPVLKRVHGSVLPLLIDVADLALFPEVNDRPGRRRRSSAADDTDARTPRRPVPVAALGHRGSPALLGWIVFPVFREGEATRLEPVGPAESVFLLMQATLNANIWGERGLLLARELAETVPISRLIVGAPDEAVRLLLGLPKESAEAG